MEVNIVKLSDWRIPRQFIQDWMISVEKELKKRAGFRLKNKEITLAFVDKIRIKNLNQDFRSKSKPTDILSFSGFIEKELGELVLCGEIVDSQAADNRLSRNEELGYLLIHGILHLLNYEHESGDKKAREMFQLQDDIFDTLRKRYF